MAFRTWDESAGTIRVIPATEDRAWIFDQTPDEIFSDKGDYLLTVEITAKAMPTITAELNFHCEGGASCLNIVSQN
jgi:hypothetical protein